MARIDHRSLQVLYNSDAFIGNLELLRKARIWVYEWLIIYVAMVVSLIVVFILSDRVWLFTFISVLCSLSVVIGVLVFKEVSKVNRYKRIAISLGNELISDIVSEPIVYKAVYSVNPMQTSSDKGEDYDFIVLNKKFLLQKRLEDFENLGYYGARRLYYRARLNIKGRRRRSWFSRFIRNVRYFILSIRNEEHVNKTKTIEDK